MFLKVRLQPNELQTARIQRVPRVERLKVIHFKKFYTTRSTRHGVLVNYIIRTD